MKRNKEKVPEFDEIIFENRNKSYGAYDLRKRYNSAASLSVIVGITLWTILVMALTSGIEVGTASTGTTSVVLVMSNPDIPVFVPPVDQKPPAELTNIIRNIKPVVSDDTAKTIEYIPTTDEILTTVQNTSINDTVTVTTIAEPVTPPEVKPFIVVEEMPEYPGGNAALFKYIAENLIYPPDALNNNIEGRVILKFVVNANGSVDRIDVLRSIDPLLDNEAIRVVNSLPGFKPGRQGGVAVPVWFTLPVTFKLGQN